MVSYFIPPGEVMAKRHLTARTIGPAEIPKFDYIAEAHGCLFDRFAWPSLLGDTIKRVGIYDPNDQLRGGFCFAEERKLGFRVYRTPPFIPHIGPFFEYRTSNPASRSQEQRHVMEAMAHFLDNSGAAAVSLGLSMDSNDALPFYWRNFKVIPRYTYRIDLRLSPEEILARMSPDQRNGIAKAKRDGIETAEMNAIEELRSFISSTLSRQGLSIREDLLRALLSSFPPGSGSFAFQAISPDKLLAVTYCVYDARTAYYLLGGFQKDEGHHGAGPLALYRSVLKAQEMGLETFDFEGSMVPAIERYFRSFGGTLTPYFSVQKAWLPIEIALKLVKRSLF